MYLLHFSLKPSNSGFAPLASGPGAVSPQFIWAMAPATDLLVPELQTEIAMKAASTLLQAEQNLQPAVIGLGHGNLTNVTVNRRAGESPYLKPTDIDPHLGVIRVDSINGTALATLWNFAIHGRRLFHFFPGIPTSCSWRRPHPAFFLLTLYLFFPDPPL